MTPMAHVRRVVLGHNWQDLAEWVDALDELADLSDEEIDRIAASVTAPERLPRVAA